MPEWPISKYLGQDYRDVLQAAASPTRIDTDQPIVPVVLINDGLPRPRANQRLRYALLRVSVAGDSSALQIASVSSTTKIYYLGMVAMQSAAQQVVMNIYDAITGNPPSITVNVVASDRAGFLAYSVLPASVGEFQIHTPPMPVQVQTGIRVLYTLPGASQAEYIFFWLEETIG